MAFVGLLLLSKCVILVRSRVFLTTGGSYGTPHLDLGFVGMDSAAAASMLEMMQFSYLSFGLYISDISYKISNLFHTVTEYLLLISLLISDWLVCWVLWHINLCRLFNAKSIFM